MKKIIFSMFLAAFIVACATFYLSMPKGVHFVAQTFDVFTNKIFKIEGVVTRNGEYFTLNSPSCKAGFDIALSTPVTSQEKLITTSIENNRDFITFVVADFRYVRVNGHRNLKIEKIHKMYSISKDQRGYFDISEKCFS